MQVSIVTPVRHTINIEPFLKRNRLEIELCEKIIVCKEPSPLGIYNPSGVGIYHVSGDLYQARQFGIEKSQSEYTLCLDSDVTLPEAYIVNALQIMAHTNASAVASFFDPVRHFGVLEFGASFWNTKTLLDLYDYDKKPPQCVDCECIYMWKKLKHANLKLEVHLQRPLHLEHLK